MTMAKTRRPITRATKEALADTPDSFESPESSLIAGASYDRHTWALDVRFKRTREESDTYRYEGINPNQWREFVQSTSKGAFFNQQIRPLVPGKMVKLPKAPEPSPVV